MPSRNRVVRAVAAAVARRLRILAFLFASIGALLSHAQDKTTYADHVRPLLQTRCFSCHNADKKKGGLDLTSNAALLAGGSGGAVVEAGNHASSRLWTLTARKQEPFMPPQGEPLATAELELLARWIDGGLLETASSVARKTDRPKLELVIPATGKPEGPPPMPEDLLLEPVVVAERTSAVTALAASPWAPLLAVGGAKQIILYHADSFELAGILPYPEGYLCSLRFSRNGALLVAGGGHGALRGSVVLFEVKSGRRLAEVGNELDTVLSADLRSDHSMIAFGTPGKKLKVYDLAGTERYARDKHSEWVTAVAFSPDGVLLASGDRNGGLRVWESDNGAEYLNLEAHKAAITALAWRPDSNVLASSSEDGEIILWEMNQGGIVKRWAAHAGGTLCVDYAQDGNLVTSGRDRHVKLWKGDGQLLKDLGQTADLPTRVAFLHDPARLAVGTWTGDVSFWRGDSNQPLATLTQNPPSLASRLAAQRQKVAELTPPAQAAEQSVSAAAQALAATDQAIAAAQQRAAEAKARAAKALEEAAEAEKQSVALTSQRDAQGQECEARKAALQRIAEQIAAHTTTIARLEAAQFNVGLRAEQDTLAKLETDLKAQQETLTTARAAQTDREHQLAEAKARLAKIEQDLPLLEATIARLEAGLAEATQSANQAQASAAQTEAAFATQKAKVDQLRAQYLARLPK